MERCREAECLNEKMGAMRYWLSYDLGLRGNYDELYEWLDGLKAKECGDSVATFITDRTRDQIAQELSGILDKSARVYLINTRSGGRFIMGRRKAAPWYGYAQTEEAEDSP